MAEFPYPHMDERLSKYQIVESELPPGVLTLSGDVGYLRQWGINEALIQT